MVNMVHSVVVAVLYNAVFPKLFQVTDHKNQNFFLRTTNLFGGPF